MCLPRTFLPARPASQLPGTNLLFAVFGFSVFRSSGVSFARRHLVSMTRFEERHNFHLFRGEAGGEIFFTLQLTLRRANRIAPLLGIENNLGQKIILAVFLENQSRRL